MNNKRKFIRRRTDLNKEIKQNESKQKREILTDNDIDLGKFFEIAPSDKIYVNSVNLYEIKNETLQDYTGDFELNVLMLIGPIEHKTNIRFEKMDEFESYTNAIDIYYDNEDVTFSGHFYKLNTPRFNVVKRSAHDKGTIYVQEIVEYHGKNCFFPTSGHCFIKCINFFTKKDYTQAFLTSIPSENYQSGVITSARTQPSCRKYNIYIGCFDGTRINPQNMTQRDKEIQH